MDHFLWHHTMTTTVVLLAILAIRRLLAGRLSPALRHLLWGFVPLALWMPLIYLKVEDRGQTTVDRKYITHEPEAVLPTFTPINEASSETKYEPRFFPLKKETSSVAAEFIPTTPVKPTPAPKIEPKRELPSFAWIITAIWLCGVVSLSTLFVYRIVAFRRRLRFATPVAEENVLRILDQCKTRLNIQRNVRLYECSRLAAPILVGIFKPRILLPKNGRPWPDAALTPLFLHELAHLRRQDIFTTLAASLFCIAYWFNPLVWLAARLMSDDAEEAADRLALRDSLSAERAAYSRSLIEFAERFHVKSPLPRYVGLGILPLSPPHRKRNSTRLSRRIEMIHEHKKWNRFTALLAVMLCVGTCIAVLTRIQYVQAQYEEKQQPTDSAVDTPQPAKPIEPVRDTKVVKIKGRVILPDGESTEGLALRLSGLGQSGWTSGGGGVEPDGAFTLSAPENTACAISVHDRKNRFAVPYKIVVVGKESPKETIYFQMKKAIQLTAKFVDETTGEPIPGLRITLAQKIEKTRAKDRDKEVDFDMQSDQQGSFQTQILPGKYTISIDHRAIYPGELEKGRYARSFTVKPDETSVEMEFKIPTPFVGKVVSPQGNPVRNRRVAIMSSDRSNLLKPSVFTETNFNGIFRSVVPPVDVTVEVYERGGDQFYAWFGNELAGAKEHTFQLVESTIAQGRLVDAKTKEPLASRLFYYWEKNPADPKQHSFMPSFATTKADGTFSIELNPTLSYDLFTVYGRDSYAPASTYWPRIDLASIEPKEDMDLGDLVVDSEKARMEPPDEPQTPGVRTAVMQEMEKQRKRILSNEKRSLLMILYTPQMQETVDELLKHQEDGLLKEFAITPICSDTLAPEDQRLLEEDDSTLKKQFDETQFVIALDPCDNYFDGAEEYHMNFKELRGEQDSPWKDVPPDEVAPSNDAWKANPKYFDLAILHYFLADHLKKLADKNSAVFQIILGESKENDTGKSLVALVAEKVKSLGGEDSHDGGFQEALKNLAEENKMEIVSQPQISTLKDMPAFVVVTSDPEKAETMLMLSWNERKKSYNDDNPMILLELQLEKTVKTVSGVPALNKVPALSKAFESTTEQTYQWNTLASLTEGAPLLLSGTLDGREFVLFVSVKRP